MAEPHHPIRPDEPAHGEPHGIVHEIREEIEHAVEHVPAPVRWTFRKLALLIGASLAGLVVILVVTAALYVANRTEWAAKELTVFLNQTLARRSNVEIVIQDIKGNPLREITLRHPVVRFREGDLPTVLEAKSVRMRYTLWGLVTSGGRAIEVDVDEPVIRVERDATGHWMLPTWTAAGKPSKNPSGYDVRVRLHNGRGFGPAPIGTIDGIQLDASVRIGQGTVVQLRRLQWRSGPYASKNVEIEGELAAGDSVLFKVRKLRSDDLALRASGGWKKGEHAKQIHVDLEQLQWRWLAVVTGNRSFDVPGTGRGSFDLVQDESWHGGGSAHVEWNGMPGDADGSFLWKNDALVVEPLHAHAPVGDLDGRLAWSRAGWEVGGHALRSNPEEWDAIGIPGWPKGNLNGDFRYAVETKGAPSGELTAALGESEIAGWRADQARVRVAFPEVGPDSFTVVMLRRGGDVTLLGAAEKGGWTGAWTAQNFPLDEWPDGRASGIRGTLARGQGGVVGRNGELLVTGDLGGTGTDWLGAHMADWRLDQVTGRLLPTPDLSAQARLGDLMFLGVHFDSAAVGFRLGDRTVALETVRAVAADTVITTAGQVVWSEAGWRTRLDRAEAHSRQFQWNADPPIVLSGDPAGVVFDRFRAHDGAATAELGGRWASPGGSYDWHGDVRSLDVSRIGLPVEWGFGGTAHATLRVTGHSGDPSWTLEGECSRPAWEGHHGDSLSLALSGSKGTLAVRRGAFTLGGGTLRANGRVERMREDWPDTLTADGVVRWVSHGAAWRGEVTAAGFPLEPLGGLSPQAAGWAGRVNGRLTIDGSPGHPEFDVTVDAKPLAWRGYLADEVTANARYRGERLEVSKLTMTRGTLVSTASGALPLRLALGRNPEVPEAPMSWSVEMPNGDLSVLPLFIPQLESAAGRLELHARVEGTPRHPDLNGTMRVSDGKVRLEGREELLEDLRAEIRLDESHITLDSLTARQGLRGQVRARGAVELAGAQMKGYQFQLQMREFTAVESGLYAVQFDGDFDVTNGPRWNGQVVPFVTGNLDVRRAVVLFDFANQSEVQQLAATTQPLQWTYRVQLNAKNNLHWQPPDGDIEFSANLSLEQTADRLLIYGDMQSLRGTYFFLSNRFAVRRANLTFDNLSGVNPVIDAEATTRIAGSSRGTVSAGAGAEAHDVTVTIRGRADEPVIEFASNPDDWDEATVLRELTVGRFYAGGVTLQDPLDHYLTRAINKTLSAELSRAFKGYINEWTLDRERGGLVSGDGDVILGVGTQITPNLLVRYRQRVPGLGRGDPAPLTGAGTDPFERDVEAEYRINRFFYITSELIQRRVLTGSTSISTATPDFNLNLKARWEY